MALDVTHYLQDCLQDRELDLLDARMETAAQFCRANGFFWYGVITESQNLREFIFQQASFCLLDFTIFKYTFNTFQRRC